MEMTGKVSKYSSSKGMGIIIKAKTLSIDKSILMVLYHGLVDPYNIVWESTHNTYLDKLILLKKKNYKNIIKQSLKWSHRSTIQKFKNIKSKANDYIPNGSAHV